MGKRTGGGACDPDGRATIVAAGSDGGDLDVPGALGEFREAQEAVLALWKDAPVCQGQPEAVAERLNGGSVVMEDLDWILCDELTRRPSE